MNTLQTLIDLIKQTYAWLNEKFESFGLKGTKLRIAKIATLFLLIVTAYFVIQPVPWEQKSGLHVLKALHAKCEKGEAPDWPLDWRPIRPPKEATEDSDKEKAAPAITHLSDFDKAMNLLESEKYEAAASLLSKKKDSADGEEQIAIINNLGFAEIHLGRYKDAIDNLNQSENMKDALRKKIAKDGSKQYMLTWSDVSSRVNLGEANYYAGNLQQAKDNLTEADNAADSIKESLPPNYRSEIAYYLGLNSLMLKDLKSALHHFQKAAALEDACIPAEGKPDRNELSNWAATNFCLAMTWQATGQLQQAARTYKKVEEKLRASDAVLDAESLKIVADCQRTTLPVWQRCLNSIVPSAEEEK